MHPYSKGSHTVYYHRYHIVWITQYRYRVLQGDLQKRIRDIILQVATEKHIKVLNGVISRDHVHLHCSIPPHISVSEFVKLVKWRSSFKVQKEFPELKKKYWGCHFWARGYFSTTIGNVTEDMIDEYINSHTDAHFKDLNHNISLE
jgi:putative transposase